MTACNRLFLLAGAGALALGGAAAAQDAGTEDNTAQEAQIANPETGPRSEGEAARVNTAEGAPGLARDSEASPRDVNAAAHSRLRDEGGFVAPGEQVADETQEDEVARSERVAQSPHQAHTAEDRFVDDEMLDDRVDPDSAEAALVREALEENRSLLDYAASEGELDAAQYRPAAQDWNAEAESREVDMIRTFAQIDADGDFLITPVEWRAREAGAAIAPFGEVDLNATGSLGFAEYRAWNARRAADAAADDAGDPES